MYMLNWHQISIYSNQESEKPVNTKQNKSFQRTVYQILVKTNADRKSQRKYFAEPSYIFEDCSVWDGFTHRNLTKNAGFHRKCVPTKVPLITLATYLFICHRNNHLTVVNTLKTLIFDSYIYIMHNFTSAMFVLFPYLVWLKISTNQIASFLSGKMLSSWQTF